MKCRNVQAALTAALLSCLSAPGSAQDSRAASALQDAPAIARVEVVGARDYDPDEKSYRSLLAGVAIFEKKQQLASQSHKNGIQEGEFRAMAANQGNANAEVDRLRAQLAAAGTEIALLRARNSTRGGAKTGTPTSQKLAASGAQASTRKRTKGSEKSG